VREKKMGDVLYLVLIVGFLVLLLGYAVVCEKL
jgi:hypothetical protein